MDKQSIKSVLTDAADIVSDLPSNLQVKAFELAAAMLAGAPSVLSNGNGASAKGQPQVQHAQTDADLAVSDLLPLCGSNYDRYIVFMHELERKGQELTSTALEAMFGTYQQDRPKNVARDLRMLKSWDWAEPSEKKRGAAWLLKRKGRERYTELVALANGAE